MELKQYLIPLRKWWWLLVITTVISAFSAYFATQIQAPQYQATAALMIGQAIEDPNPSGTDFFLETQLAQAYADIAQRQVVRQATMDVLGLSWLPEYRVSVLPSNQIIEIATVDTVPERAQAVANTLAEQLVLQSPTSEQRVDQQRQEFINDRLDNLEVQIQETENDITALQDELGNMISARQIAETSAQITGLQAKLTTLETNYATLVDNTQQGAANILRIIEPALLPSTPIGSGKATIVLLGAAIGFGLATGAAYFMEYLDDSLKSPKEISEVTGLPVIGFIAATAENSGENRRILVSEEPRSPVAEAFRALRTNLEFAGVDKPLRTLLVTSPNPSDGKTTIAVNLAAIMAQGGARVFLIDADLRRPSVHRFLDIANNIGLSDLFTSRNGFQDAVYAGVDLLPNMKVLRTGSLPPNPAELLGSAKMESILDQAKALSDVVIIDSPPFVVSDPVILAAKVDGVIIVLQPDRTNAETVKAMVEQLNRANSRVVGIVLNRIPCKQGLHYPDYLTYYAPYYTYAGHYAYINGVRQNGHGLIKNINQIENLMRELRNMF